MKKAILHIGVHKTGTTTIQNWMWSNKDIIKSGSGWSYPKKFSVQNAHHVIPWSVMPHFLDNPISHPHCRPLDEIRKELQYCENVVLSSEAFCMADDEAVQRIKWLFDDFETTVVIYTRRQDKIIQSEYVQRVKQEVFPLCDPFPEFSLLWRRIVPALDFYGLFQKWNRHFNKVVVKDFDTCVKGGLIRSFLGMLQADRFAPTNEVPDNVSLNYYYASALREANMLETFFPGARDRMMEVLSTISFPPGKLSFFNGAEAHRFMDQFQDGNNRLVHEAGGEFSGFDQSYPYIMPHQFVDTRECKFIDWLYKVNRNRGFRK